MDIEKAADVPSCNTLIDCIAKLIYGKPMLPNDFATPIRMMLSTWGITDYDELNIFTGDNVHSFLSVMDPDKLGSFLFPLHHKRLAYLIDYAHLGGSLSDVTLIKDVVSHVDQLSRYNTSSLASDGSSGGTYIKKKIVPKLETSSQDEDWFKFKENVTNNLGKAGLAHYLMEEELVIKNSEVTEGVFYTLKKALSGGHTQHLA